MKKQIKKLMSLVMAVLMLMSCWVWVAPTDAEAANTAAEGYYYVKIFGQVSDTMTLTANSITVTSLLNNGTSTTTTTTSLTVDTNILASAADGTEVVFGYGWVNGFPKYWSWSMTASSDCDSRKGGTVHDFYMAVSDSADGTFTMISKAKDSFGVEDGKSGSYTTGSGAGAFDSDTSKYPFISSITAPAEQTVTLNAIGGAAVTSNLMSFTAKDQYGVTWVGGAPSGTTFHVSDSAGGSEGTYTNDVYTGAQASVTGQSGLGAKITVNPGFQAVRTAGAGGVTPIYLVVTTEKAQASAKLNVKYPTYSWTFNGNGDSGTATNAALTLKDGTTATGSWTSSGNYYGKPLTNYPTAAEKAGYEFYGFWSKDQSDAGSDAYAYESDFLKPISSEEYAALSDKTGYADAGTQYSSDAAVEGSKTWYAWWCSSDVNVDFYDADGSYLASVVTKYGKTNSDITWPDPMDNYSNGAFEYQTFSGIWMNIDSEKVSENGYTFTHDLILSPTYTNKVYTDTYTVTFKNTYSGNLSSKTYDYRAQAEWTAPAVPSSTEAYDYEFIGWTTQTPSTYTTRHIVCEDGNYDADIFDSSKEIEMIYLVTDFTVKGNATYYPVFRRVLKSYNVTVAWLDAAGNEVSETTSYKYGSTVTLPANVNWSYAYNGYQYNFDRWQVGQDTININQYVVPGQDVTIQAVYLKGAATALDVVFAYKDATGEDLTTEYKVAFGDKITAESVDAVVVPETYDDGDNTYKFTGNWILNLDGEAYTAAEAAEYAPSNHVTFTAEYEVTGTYYTVTYIDGNESFTKKVLGGSVLPTWEVESEDGEETTEYLPEREDTIEGEYTLLGWYDAVDDDSDKEETTANKYVPGETIVSGDVTLYPHFQFGLFEYTISFVNYDGTVLASGKYHYGEDIQALTAEAVAAATRDADETYTYTFLGWDHTVPHACGSSDLTFTAQYKATYIKYEAEWYNSEDEMNDGADPLKVTKHTYGSKLFTPSVTLTAPKSSDDEQSYVFAGWCYKDAEGNEHAYTRGMAVSGNLKLYATYELAAKLYTVSVYADYEDVNAYYTVSVKSGETLKNLVSDPADGYYDETYHYSFGYWYANGDKNDTFDIANTEITSDISIYAEFITEKHSYTKSALVTAPTYPVAEVTDGEGNVLVEGSDGKGELYKYCECDLERTQQSEEIPALTDAVAPGAVAYMGSKWNSKEGTTSETIYVNPDTAFIIATTDTGDYNATYNANSDGIGVAKIEVEVSNGTKATLFDWEQTQLDLIDEYGSWAAVPEMYKNYNANAVILAKECGLDDGSSYSATITITDKNGNESEMTTCTFIYDSSAPELSYTGSGNDTNTKFCETVTVSFTDNVAIASCTVNGNAVIVSRMNTVEISEEGTYKIVVADMAGNTVTKTLKVMAHSYNTYITAATCEEAGKEKGECTNCGGTYEKETSPALGHDEKTVTVAATCEQNGYDLTTCSRCDYELIVDSNGYVEDDLGILVPDYKYPATGHDHAATKSVDATCVKKGYTIYTCTKCGDTYTVETDDVDPDAHKWSSVKTVKATCTEDGYTWKYCRLCRQTETIGTIEKTGHTKNSGVVTKAPTCAEKGEMSYNCKVCNIALETEEIAATGIHTWDYIGIVDCVKVTATDDETGEEVITYTEITDETSDADAVVTTCAKYVCSVCGEVYLVEDEVVEEFTVTFLDENGDELGEVKINDGESLTADDMADPTKASTETYKYTFAGWTVCTVAEDGTVTETETVVTLPTVVEGNMTLKAKFNATKIVYTATFMAPTAYEVDADGNIEYEFGTYKQLLGTYGDVVAPSANPTFSSDETYKFTFDKWVEVSGDDLSTLKGNTTYEAVFKAEQMTYDVHFVSGTTWLYTAEDVKSGETAVYVGAVPEKAYDSDYHYTFKAWDKALTNIKAETVIYAQFNSIGHELEAGTVTPATCTTPEYTEYTCDCGYTTTKKTADAAGHTPLEPKLENGEYVTYCKDCGDVISRENATIAILFYNEVDGAKLGSATVEFNNAEALAEKAAAYEAKAGKKADYENTYTFAGWVDAEGNKYTSATLPAPTTDTSYWAYYTSTARTYTVTYIRGEGDYEPLQINKGIKFGEAIPAFTGDASKIVVPGYTNSEHYVANGWSVADGAVVSAETITDNANSAIVIRPVFTKAAHTMASKTTEKTCTTDGGIMHYCTDGCGYQYIDGTDYATGHVWKKTNTVNATFTSEGYIEYTCSACGETKTETIPMRTYKTVTVTVKDSSGNAVEGATVQLYKDGAWVAKTYSDANGKAVFTVADEGTYTVIVSGIDGADSYEYTISVGSDGYNDNGNPGKTAAIVGCSCSCHRNGFWGTIFRFFHKLIAFFTGSVKCCSCPDSRY